MKLIDESIQKNQNSSILEKEVLVKLIGDKNKNNKFYFYILIFE